jgi:hypothetical protein
MIGKNRFIKQHSFETAVQMISPFHHAHSYIHNTCNRSRWNCSFLISCLFINNSPQTRVCGAIRTSIRTSPPFPLENLFMVNNIPCREIFEPFEPRGKTTFCMPLHVTLCPKEIIHDPSHWQTSPRFQPQEPGRHRDPPLTVPRLQRRPGVLPARLDARLNGADPFVPGAAGPVRRDADPGPGSFR